MSKTWSRAGLSQTGGVLKHTRTHEVKEHNHTHTKINQPNMTAVVDHDVFRLEVAIYDLALFFFQAACEQDGHVSYTPAWLSMSTA